MGVLFRLTGGEPYLGFHAAIEYPGFVAEPCDEYSCKPGKQNFPFKTMAMLIALTTLVIVSLITDFLFKKEYLKRQHDILHVFHEPQPKSYAVADVDEKPEKAVELTPSDGHYAHNGAVSTTVPA